MSPERFRDLALSQSPAPLPRQLSPGELLANRFEIVRHLGAGGMGDVYEAIDRTLGGPIAIKTMRADIAANPQAIARFQREILLARKITHPNICRVFDLVSGPRSSDGVIVNFLTMEYIDGETLSNLLRRDAPLTLSTALPLIEQIAAGLDAAHAARIMHRDLKASNIMIARDAAGAPRAVITDFGLARSIEGGDTIATGSGWGAGTPAYMAPEQIEGRELSHAADIYALGVVMYEMATGAQPYTGESPLQVAVKRIKELPARPRESNAAIDPAWEAAILKCLAYDPAQRFPTATAIVEALRGGRIVRVPSAILHPKPWMIAAPLAALALIILVWFFRDPLLAPTIPPDTERLYVEGLHAIQDGAYHKATQLLESATSQAPAFAAAHCRLAEAWQELDDRDKARQELVKAIDGRPRSTEERLLRDATKSYLTGNWDAALAALQARVSHVANPTDALLDIARLYDRAGRADQAIPAYRQILERDKNRPGAMLRLAELLAARGHQEEAAKWLTTAAAAYQSFSNPEGQGQALLARANMERNIPAAAALADQALSLARVSGSQSLLIRAQMRQAQALEAAGEAEPARLLRDETIRLAEASGLGSLAAMALYDLGYQFFTQRKAGIAARYFQLSLQIAQRYGSKYAEANARLGWADVLLYSGNRDTNLSELIQPALTFFEQTGYRSRLVQGLTVKAGIALAKSAFEESHAIYLDALRIAETDYDRARVQEFIARLAVRRLRYEDAVTGYQQAVEFRHKAGETTREQFARLELSAALRACGRFDEAQQQLDIIAAQKPTDPTVTYSLVEYAATLDFQRGRFGPAIEALRQLLQQSEADKQDSRVRDLKSEICVKAGEAGQAALALRYCREMLVLRQGNPAFQIDLYSGLALAYFAQRQLPEALSNARRSVELSKQTSKVRDIFYQGMILTRILHAVRDPGWQAQRESVRQTLAQIEKDLGPQAIRLYLARPTVAAHWKAVQSLN